MSPAETYRDFQLGWMTRQNPPNQTSRLGAWLILGGPLVGLGLALLVEASGEVLPVDRSSNRWLFGLIGSIAGVLASLLVAASAALVGKDSNRDNDGPNSLAQRHLGTSKLRFDDDNRTTSPHAPGDSVPTFLDSDGRR